ncbi:MAG TPA: hypothetical protein VMP68_28425, partial [Candidatus Eisenbacteria bacterium]|nr:hypothetical protein [Candidatus Eisenbacteria bacterium]
MNRSGTAIVAFLPVLLRTRNLAKFLGATAPVLLVLFAATPGSVGQTLPVDTGAASVLGPHNEGARGCTLCHASRSSGGTVLEGPEADSFLWGRSDLSYASTVALANGSRYVEVNSSSLQGASGEISGVLICLSCHDGNLTPYNMMQSWSYEHQVGLLTSTQFSRQKIPSLLGRDEAPIEDHPIGQNARINPGGGLVFSNGTFSVTPNSPYAAFISNYGWPSLVPGPRSKAIGITSSGEPYTLCTTCHNQHVRNVYASWTGSPIEGDDSGRFYTTYFFVNGPYDPTQDKLSGYPTTSSAQFCRQCHFDLANEGNNTLHARTLF